MPETVSSRTWRGWEAVRIPPGYVLQFGRNHRRIDAAEFVDTTGASLSHLHHTRGAPKGGLDVLEPPMPASSLPAPFSHRVRMGPPNAARPLQGRATQFVFGPLTFIERPGQVALRLLLAAARSWRAGQAPPPPPNHLLGGDRVPVRDRAIRGQKAHVHAQCRDVDDHRAELTLGVIHHRVVKRAAASLA